MPKEIIKEIKGLNYGCSKCVYSKDDDISCLRNGGCGTENPRQYYELVDDTPGMEFRMRQFGLQLKDSQNT